MARRIISNATSRNEFIRSATKVDSRNIPRAIRRGGNML